MLSDTSENRYASSRSQEVVTNYFSGGNKQYEGYRKNGKWQGAWMSWHKNGSKIDSGSLQSGIPDGEWKVWGENGAPKYVRTYSSEKWKEYQHEKVRYHQRKVNLRITQLFHENKNKAALYTNAINTFCAPATCGRSEHESLSQKIDNNSKDHYHPLFQNGLLHGPFINYFPDGKIKDSGNYKDGLPEGLWLKWTDDKQYYWKGHYLHGLKNKEWKLYMANDKLVRVAFYKNGKYIWRKDFKDDLLIGDANDH